MDKKLLFIVNPRAGRTKSFAPLFDAVACFSKAGYLVKVFLTGGRGDATRAAAELGGAYDLVVCAGGDGTFNEMVSGLSSCLSVRRWAISPTAAPTTLPPACISPPRR